MDNFNMKQWLQENKIGPYGKVNLNEMNPVTLGMGQEEADIEMQKKDDKEGDWVDNISMDVMAEGPSRSKVITVPEWEVNVLGKDHMISADVDIDYDVDEPDYLDGRMISSGGAYVTDATAKITKLEVEDGDEYREVNDPAYIKQIEDLINKDPKLNRGLKDEVSFWAEDLGAEDDYEDTYDGYDDMDETVGYAMKTKESDPAKKF